MKSIMGATTAAATYYQVQGGFKWWTYLIILLMALRFCRSLCTADDMQGNIQLPKRQVHVVYMGRADTTHDKATDLHKTILTHVLKSEKEASRAMVYSYTSTFNGFAAKLSAAEAKSISAMEGVVSVFPSSVKKLLTTRSWDFLGLSITKSHDLPTGGSHDVIIGMLDTGVWPESESFNDEQIMDPIPSRWKGRCVSGDSFNASINCNRKLIGARIYLKGYEQQIGPITGPGEFRSPRDAEGHGSHTASTAGGNVVTGANLFGLANGTARGGTPTARIAVYKVCWFGSCTDADILAAFNEAVADGVDLISFSIGGGIPQYFQDSIAIGAFHAVQKGVLVSCAAGNNGPYAYTATNIAPWLTTVAATSIDRKFISSILLGDNTTYMGTAINTIPLSHPWYPLVIGAAVVNKSSDYREYAKYCLEGSLDTRKVKGRIVVCEGGLGAADSSVLEAGGAGVILVDSFDKSVGFAFSLPTSAIDKDDAQHILQYINTSSSPVATILPSVAVLSDSFLATTAIFSSRGPNLITPSILKPDLAAPGLDILAAWSPVSSISGESIDTRSTPFNIISGTSMACPHVTGAAAFVKSFHPHWTPAAIKSALMTTATPLDSSQDANNNRALGYGSGLISPVKALDPGLVYDTDMTDYFLFFCALNYTSQQIQLITGSNFSCAKSLHDHRHNLLLSANDLNYPSIGIANAQEGSSLNKSIIRTLRNVAGSSSSAHASTNLSSTYTVQIEAPEGVQITVSPTSLHFNAPNERHSFLVHFQANASSLAVANFDINIKKEQYMFGSLTWTDGSIHSVRSPILIIWTSSSSTTPVIQ